jgi:transglutaminase-like putative cysteine protease
MSSPLLIRVVLTVVNKMTAVWLVGILLIGAVSCLASAAALPPLPQAPAGERWFFISMNGEQVGFARQRITPTANGYRFDCDGSVKMLVLGFSREASAHESYLVGKDLALQSFAVEQIIDHSPMKLHGESTAKGFKLVLESGGTKKEKLLKAKGAVYPPPVLNLYPLFKGAGEGKKYKVQLLDVEAVKIKEVVINALGQEMLPEGGTAYHLQNDLYPFVSNDIWVDLQGNTLKESVRDGLILTQAADEAAVRQFVLAAAVAKKDLVLDFSLVRTDRQLAQPAAIRALEVAVTGIPAAMAIPGGAGQQVARNASGVAVFAVDRQQAVVAGASQTEAREAKQFLAATDRIPADHPRIRELAGQLLTAADTPRAAAEKLNAWVTTTIADVVSDSQTPLETLESKKGNCQSHARLYTALARAAGIPTKFVSGLVYLPKQGFLYHSWAESYLGEWVAVDPTFGQLPADATHLKLVEGERVDDLAPLAGLVGAIQIKITKVVE